MEYYSKQRGNIEMKKLNSIVLILLLGTISYAQESGVSVRIGIGSYQFNDMKLYQDEIIAISPVDAKGFTYFPPYTNLKFQFYKKNYIGLKFGIFYGYSATGAYATYTDYSGTMNITQNISAFQLGASLYYPLVFKNYFEISTYGSLMFGYIHNRIIESISTFNYFEDHSVRQKAFSPSAEVGFEAIYHLLKYTLGIEAGYQYDVGGTFKITEADSEDAKLILPERAGHSNLSGIRLTAKFILRFNANLLYE